MNNRETDIKKGVIFIALGFFFMAVFGIFIKISSKSTSSIWINFIAYATSLVLIIPLVAGKGFSSLKTHRFPLHFCRALFGFLASLLYIVSVGFIPLLNATLLFNTAPIFIPFFVMIFWKTKILSITWFSIILGFIGIIFIIRPSADILSQSGNFIGLASGISLALAYTFIKMLTPTDPPLRILFYFFFLATFMQVPLVLFAGKPPSQENFGLAMCAGAALTVAQWFIVKAYTYAEASKIGVFQYTTVVYVGIIDWVIWNVTPTLSDYIGAILVIIAGGLIIYSHRIKSVRI